MSEDEFNTVNVKRQQMARELESLRQRYQQHRETIARLEADAPSEALAARYADLRRELESALAKVDDLSGRRAVEANTIPGRAPLATATAPGTAADWQNRPVLNDGVTTRDIPAAEEAHVTDSNRRLAIIGIGGLLLLLILGAVAYRYSQRKKTAPVVVESTSTAPASASTQTVALPAEAADGLTVTPTSHDFGTVKKGTRAVRQFRIENHSASPVTVTAKRSTCRCLWFDYDKTIDAHGTTVLAVTLDGAKAKSGPLNETIELSWKGGNASAEVHGKVE